MSSADTPNRLIHEASPYLLQHARNPVNWYPWGDEAFERAAAEDKPVFLSVGYSACHWCHVMERESFMDGDVAEALNEGFIAVKVDREERPDVDHLYMLACMALTGSGGWPLTVFLTPDKKPFYAGTYYPKHDRDGRAGLLTLLAGISDSWEKRRKKLERAAERILEHIDEGAVPDRPRTPFYHPSSLSANLAGQAAALLMAQYDHRWGGFSRSAPKFPSPHNLMFIMRGARHEPMDSPAWSAARHTLSAMAAGGLRDHVGGGFCRYSTDAMWLVPHFEKMLYDNALLTMAYTECYEKTGEFAHIIRETVNFVRRDMAAPSGGFYTAIDAESEGVEGKYYCWTPEQVKEALGERDGARFCFLYDITANGNFEGMSIPNLVKMPVGGDDMAFASIVLPKLLEARRKRPAPLTDTKVLLSSGALMAAALAKAGRALDEPVYTRHAEDSVHFFIEHMRAGRGLAAVYGGGSPATLDGCAYLLWALLEVYHSTLNPRYLDEARVLGGLILELFSGENGRLYFTASGRDDLPLRGVNAHDGAVPSGQSVAAHGFLRLSRLTGDGYWEECVRRLIQSLSDKLDAGPEAHTWMMAALLHMANGGPDVTLTSGEGLPALRAALRGFHPFMTVRLDAGGDGDAKAYVCRDNACLAPLTDPAALSALLSADALRY
ncbi:MAG: thioredoxin domain-containing protein [Oscillospiraceae bacterium]|nr:thioredoxin domain-containing protein [Oscillospiraceae bacterium]